MVTALTLPHFGIIAAAVATSAFLYSIAFVAAAAYFVRRTGIGLGSIFALSADNLRPYFLLLTSAVAVLRGR